MPSKKKSPNLKKNKIKNHRTRLHHPIFTKKRKGQFLQNIVLGFLVSALLMMIVIYVFTSAKAEVTIYPSTQNIETDYSVFIQNQQEKPEQINYFPGITFTEELELEKEFGPIRAEKTPAKAIGNITVYNNYSSTQTLIEGTRFLSKDNVLFRSLRTIIVRPGQELTVEVEADKEGVQGEVDPTEFTIPGLWEGLQDKIYGRSFDKFTEGEKTSAIVTQDHLDQNKQNIISELESNFTNKHKNELTGKKELSYSYEITDESSDANISDNKEYFTSKLKLKFKATIFDTEDLKQYHIDQLTLATPTDNDLVKIHFDDIEYLVQNIYEDNTIELTAKISGESIGQVSDDLFNKDNYTNKDENEIVDFLLNDAEVLDAKIKLTPSWLPRTPFLESRIEVNVGIL